MPRVTKSTRLFIRISERDKEALEQAADAAGVAVAAYVIDAALARAKRDLKAK